VPSDSLLKKLYSGDYEFRVDSTSLRRFKEVAQKVIARMKQLHPAGTTLFDVGAGYGTFVEVATLNKLDAIGIEPSGSLHEAVNPKFKNRVLHTDLYGFIRSNKKKFDFISLIHVIEHQKDPRKFLEVLFKLLKPEGVLYIETPNSYSHLAIVEKENYTFLTPPDHIHLFSKNSMAHILPLYTESVYKTYSYPEHLVGILRAIKNARYYKQDIRKSDTEKKLNRGVPSKNNLPFFDKHIAPLLTPLLNLGSRGSFLQVYIQKKN